MHSSVYVTASGPALSLLLYENTKTSDNQMGLLLGAVVNQVIDTISDTQIRDKKTETIINISSILPLPMASRFIGGAGNVDSKKLIAKVNFERQLKSGSQSHDVVGWYSFKRSSVFQMSYREHAVHLQFADLAHALSQDGSPELFVMCLLTNSVTSQATHVVKHSFMRYLRDKCAFDIIPLQIHNLGMTQTSQYQNTACAASKAALLKEIFDQIGPQQHGRDHMLQVQAELQKMLNQRVQQLSDAESSRIKLEKEVEELQKRVKTLMENNQVKSVTASQGHNNGPERFDHEKLCESRQHGKHSRPNNKSADIDENQDQGNSVCKNSGNFLNAQQIENEPTSPVLGFSSRRKPNKN